MSTVFKSAFYSPQDEFSGRGVRPVVFDIIGPDWETSVLPDNLKLVLHVNPSEFSLKYSKEVTKTQTKGGFVETHWGDSADTISFSMVTGGFMRLYTGLTSTTGVGVAGSRATAPSVSLGGSRRETIAYDKYLDMLALFHNNGAIYDSTGGVALQGQIKCSFDGFIWYGWFGSFNLTEDSASPFLFKYTLDFVIQREELSLRFRPGGL